MTDTATPSAIPIVRRAVLASIQPPPKDRVEQLSDCLESAWNERREELRDALARLARLPATHLEFASEEWVRRHRDGKTPMVDFPRLRAIETRRPFDVRVCMAICTDDMSSKIWARVGLPLTKVGLPEPTGSGDALEVEVDRIRERTEFFRRLAIEAAHWAYDFLKGVLRREFPDLRVRKIEELEVSVLATDDMRIAPLLEKMSVAGASAKQLLAEEESADVILRYFRDAAAAGANKGVTDESETVWFTSPNTVELDNGDLETREVLFFMKPADGATHVVGVGFDGAAHRTLAQQSALRVSRWIANRV